jgi:hypothetical protein
MMAGSWHHIADDDGYYKGTGELEAGDWIEAIEHLHGMIMYLASQLSSRGHDRLWWVERAIEHAWDEHDRVVAETRARLHQAPLWSPQ